MQRDTASVTYKLVQQDVYYNQATVYSGTGQSTTLPASGFDKYFYLESKISSTELNRTLESSDRSSSAYFFAFNI